MNILANFHIYQQTKQDRQINDKNTVTMKELFNAIISEQADSGHPKHSI